MQTDSSLWVEEYGDLLFRYAIVRVRDVATVEDLVQETLLAALKSAETFSASASMGTWLTGILKHKITDHYRKARFIVHIEDDDSDLFDDDDHWRSESDSADWHRRTPENDLETAQLRGIIRDALNNIPPSLATVFVLREIEGLPREEICSLLDITDSNYWTMLHRARLRLRHDVERRLGGVESTHPIRYEPELQGA